MPKKNPKEVKKMRPAHTLHFSVSKYPEVLKAINRLSEELDRKPHDAMRTLAKAINANTDKVVAICKDREVI